MPRSVPSFRVFISSPGDVDIERARALDVIARLSVDGEFSGRVLLEPMAWESVPRVYGRPPQLVVNDFTKPPRDCELTVVIFWGRLGTVLSSHFSKPDGSPYASGTEWELDDAITAGRPVLVYRKVGSVPPDAEPEQQRTLATFLEKRSRNTDGSRNDFLYEFDCADAFEARFTHDLRRLLREQLEAWSRPAACSVHPSRPPDPYPDGSQRAHFDKRGAFDETKGVLIVSAPTASETASRLRKDLLAQGFDVELALAAADTQKAARWMDKARQQSRCLIALWEHSMSPDFLPQAGDDMVSKPFVVALDPLPRALPAGVEVWDARRWWLQGDGRSLEGFAIQLAETAHYRASCEAVESSAPVEYELVPRQLYLERWLTYLRNRVSHYDNADIACAVLDLAITKAKHEDDNLRVSPWQPRVFAGHLVSFAPLKRDKSQTVPHVSLVLDTHALLPLNASPIPALPRPLLVVRKVNRAGKGFPEAEILKTLDHHGVPYVTRALDSNREHLLLPFYRYGDLHSYARLDDHDYTPERRDIWAAIRKAWRKGQFNHYDATSLDDRAHAFEPMSQHTQAALLRGFAQLAKSLVLFQEVLGGYVHRDIKPSNILVEAVDGQCGLVLADFEHACSAGKARLGDESRGLRPPFPAPEADKHPDLRSDVYSLALALATVLLQTVPQGDMPRAIRRDFISSTGRHGLRLHHALWDILHRATAEAPAQRLDLKALADELLLLVDAVRAADLTLLVASRWESLTAELELLRQSQPGSKEAQACALALDLLSTARQAGGEELLALADVNAASQVKGQGTPSFCLVPFRDASGRDRFWCFAGLRDWHAGSPGHRLLGWDRQSGSLVAIKTGTGEHETTMLRRVSGRPGCAQLVHTQAHYIATRFVHRGVTLQQSYGADRHLPEVRLILAREYGLPWSPGDPLHQRTWLRLMRDLVRLLCDLEGEGLYHCDIRPSNLLVSTPNPAAAPDDQPTLVLCDYDTVFTASQLRRLERQTQYHIQTHSRFLPHWVRNALVEPGHSQGETGSHPSLAHTTAVATVMASIASQQRYPDATSIDDFVTASPLADPLWSVAKDAVRRPSDVSLRRLLEVLEQQLATESGRFCVDNETAKRRLRESASPPPVRTPHKTRLRLALALLVAMALGAFYPFGQARRVETSVQPVEVLAPLPKLPQRAGPGLLRGRHVWSADHPIELHGTLVIAPGSSLTIEPGTTVFAQKGSMLVVAPGATLVADGMLGETVRPIRFVPSPDIAQQDTPRSSPNWWNGLAVLGCGPTLEDDQGRYDPEEVPSPVFSCDGPPINALEACSWRHPSGHVEPCGYGRIDGKAQQHTSGRLRYVTIDRAGVQHSPSEESNGLSLAGLTPAFHVSHILVSHAVDDCFEFFGGNVVASHLTCIEAGDDAFDTAMGYHGAVRFAFHANLKAVSRRCQDGRNSLELEAVSDADYLVELRKWPQAIFMDVAVRGAQPAKCDRRPSNAITRPDLGLVANLYYAPRAEDGPSAQMHPQNLSPGVGWLQPSWSDMSRSRRPSHRELTLVDMRGRLADARRIALAKRQHYSTILRELTDIAPDSEQSAFRQWSRPADGALPLPAWLPAEKVAP